MGHLQILRESLLGGPDHTQEERWVYSVVWCLAHGHVNAWNHPQNPPPPPAEESVAGKPAITWLTAVWPRFRDRHSPHTSPGAVESYNPEQEPCGRNFSPTQREFLQRTGG